MVTCSLYEPFAEQKENNKEVEGKMTLKQLQLYSTQFGPTIK